MRFIKVLCLLCFVSCIPLFASRRPIHTDHAIFLFDNGEKSQVAAMLEYAQQHDQERLAALDFRIILMGAALDAMTQEPFCHYPDKLISYQDLGIEEVIDRSWGREKKLNTTSLAKIRDTLVVRKKAWCPVSCALFGQFLEVLQQDLCLEVAAFRDNPNACGDTDYFKIAEEVQAIATKLIVPSADVAATISCDKQVVITGHGPIEAWQQQAESLDQSAIIECLGLNSHAPIVVYAGGYGNYYEPAFMQFLTMLQEASFIDSDVQILIVPHPRFKGELEKKLYKTLDASVQKKILLVGDEAVQHMLTIEALAIADVVVTADATSTIVAQTTALRKKVLYINPCTSPTVDKLCSQQMIHRVSDPIALIHLAQEAHELTTMHQDVLPDVFQILGIPRHGAKLLWEAFVL